MRLVTRKHGSQRASAPQQAVFEPNICGQGGLDFLTFRVGDRYMMLHFDNQEEVRELLSQAAILWKNWGDQALLKELKERFGVS